MAPAEIEKAMKRASGEESQLRKMADVVSFDATHFGSLQSNACRVIEAKFEQVEPSVVEMSVAFPGGETKKGRISGNATDGVRITGISSDKDFYVWVKSSTTESALDPKFVAPPSKDASGLTPEEVCAKVAALVASGDESGAKGYFTEESLTKWHREGIVAAWKRHKKTGGIVNGKFEQKDASDVLTKLKVESCRRLARVDGEVYSVLSLFTSEDGKVSGTGFSICLKQIDGRWKIVAPLTFN